MNQQEQSELSAVNILLVVIGDTVVNDLEVTNADVSAARVVLADTRKEILSVGWWFNSETGFVLTPDTDGFINLPANTLDVDSTSSGDAFVSRGGKLYDTANHTYTFTQPVTVDIVLDLDFPELPRAAYQCVTAQASLTFASNFDADEVQLKRLTATAVKMGQLLKKTNLKNQDTNVFNSPRASAFLGGMPTR